MSLVPPPSAPTIRLRVFGSPALLAHGATGIPSTLLPAGKPLLILSYLACHPEAWITRDQLADLAWGGGDEQSAKASLRQALYRLRQLLGSEWVETSDSGVRLAAPLQSDWEAATEAMRLGNDGTLLQCVTGSFLEGLEENDEDDLGTWLGDERSRWNQLVRDAAVREGRRALAAGRVEASITLAERAIAVRDDQLGSWELLLDGLQATETSSRLDDGLARMEVAGTRGSLKQAESLGWRALAKRVRRSAAGADRPALPTTSETPALLPLCGRDTLLEHLRHKLQAPATTVCCVAVVQGAPGFGKTRLLREYRVRYSGNGTRMVQVDAMASEQGTAWALFNRLIEALARFPEASGIDPKAAALLVSLNPQLIKRFPGISKSDSSRLGPDALPQVLSELLDAARESAPLQLLIDDAQWSDASSLEVLRSTFNRAGSGSVSCLIATRDAPLLRVPEWPVVHLPSLNAEDLDRLLEDQIPAIDSERRADAATSLLMVTGGVPIYVSRAIHRLVQSGEESLAPDQMLNTIDSLELHRDEAFPTSTGERLLLGYLAMADGPIGRIELEEFHESVTAGSFNQLLYWLQEGGWVIASEDGIGLSHDLVRRQVNDALTPAERRTFALQRAQWLVDNGGEFRDLQVAVRLYLAHGEGRLTARAVDRWSQRVGGGPRGEALAKLVLPPGAPRLLRWRIAAATTPVLMPWLLGIATAIGLASWGALGWLAQPASLRLENRPSVEPVSINAGARLRTNSVFPILSVRDRLGRVSEALDGSALSIIGWSPSVDSAKLVQPLVVKNGQVVATRLEVYDINRASATVIFRVGKVQPLAVTVSRGYEYISLAIDGGFINGMEVAQTQPEVIVAPGDSLVGLVRLRYSTPTHAVHWMLAETSTMRPAMEDTSSVATLHVGAIDGATEVMIRRQAPMTPGQYWLVWSFAAEGNAVSILSLTNWRCRTPHWNDGNDMLTVGDSGLRTVWGGGFLFLQRDLCQPDQPPSREPTDYPTAAMRVIVR